MECVPESFCQTRHFLRHVGNSLHLVVYKVTYTTTSVVLRSSKHFFATFCLYDAPRLILVCSSTLNETPSVDCNIISTFLRGYIYIYFFCYCNIQHLIQHNRRQRCCAHNISFKWRRIDYMPGIRTSLGWVLKVSVLRTSPLCFFYLHIFTRKFVDFVL